MASTGVSASAGACRATSPLRVLMICPQFRPLVGGYERAAERLSAELARQGHEVCVITERREPSWPALEESDGYLIRRLWCLYRPHLHVLTSLLSFAGFLLLRGRRYQVFHIHQYGLHAALAALIAKLLRRPAVLKTTNTGEMGIASAAAGSPPGVSPFVQRLLRAMDAYVALTARTLAELRTYGIPDRRVRVIPNGVDTQHFAPQAPRDSAAPPSEPGLNVRLDALYVGRIAAPKNPLGLLDAWKLVCAEFPSAHLTFVGRGPQSAELTRRVEALGLESSVTLAGEQTDVLPWYQAADILVLPSHREGLSNSLLEAMCCGLAIVSTRVSGSEDIFAAGDVGELVEVNDMPALAAGLLKLLRDPARRAACGQTARRIAEESFSLRAVAERTASMYRELIVGGG